MSRLPVATINIPTKVGPGAWTACLLRAINEGDVVVANEILTASQKAVLTDVAKKQGYAQYGIRQCPNPIFWDDDKFDLVAGRVTTIHGEGPWASRWPGYNAKRTQNTVVLRPRSMEADDSRDFCVIGLHWVSSGKKVPSLWRAAMRVKSRLLLTKTLWACRRKGMVAVVAGDTNIVSPFKVRVPGFRWVRGKGLDKIGLLLPRKFYRGISRFHLFIAPTDHKHGVAADLRWSRPKEVKK